MPECKSCRPWQGLRDACGVSCPLWRLRAAPLSVPCGASWLHWVPHEVTPAMTIANGKPKILKEGKTNGQQNGESIGVGNQGWNISKNGSWIMGKTECLFLGLQNPRKTGDTNGGPPSSKTCFHSSLIQCSNGFAFVQPNMTFGRWLLPMHIGQNIQLTSSLRENVAGLRLSRRPWWDGRYTWPTEFKE